jgi:hypothetical protein
MRLLLNGQELSGVVSSEATLGTALMAVQDQGIGENEVIASIWVDGEALTAERLAAWKDRPIGEFAETRVESQTRKLLAADGLRLLAAGLAESVAHRERISDDLGQGRTGEALRQLTDYLQLWNATQQSLASVARLLDVELESLEIFPDKTASSSPSIQQVGEYINRLAGQLRQLKSAIEAGDYILLGDILSYEFSQLTDEWQMLLEQLADKFED